MRARPAAGPLALVSAHRGGAGTDRARENTVEALRAAAAMDCEYVEIDVHRCADGVYVVQHDRHVRVGDRQVLIASLPFAEFARVAASALRLDDALAVLRGRTKVHLDLKFVADPTESDAAAPSAEVALVRHVVDVMGADAVVVTGLADASVAVVRAWSREHHPGLPVGLALDRDVGLRGLRALLTGRLTEVAPGRRLRDSDATLAVCGKTQARLWGARWARRHDLPLLVWTVDDRRRLRWWLTGGRAWLVTTNVPGRALELRRELAGTGAPVA